MTSRMSVAEFKALGNPEAQRAPAKGPSEKVITAQIRAYLRFKKIFHWKAWQGLGSEKGVPDILGVLPDGRALLIEVKAARGRVSPHQEKFIQAARATGALAFVARSVEDVMEAGI